MRRLLLATRNPGKVREYRHLLRGVPFWLTTLAARKLREEAPEPGTSYEENAVAKATFYARLSGLPALADDSGLEVDALGGEPGIRSARYPGSTDEERYRRLLREMVQVPWAGRTARFVCVIALVTPEGQVEARRGQCAGYVALAPQGKLGFGYDPVFCLPELSKTMAQLSLAEKSRLSHRGEAALQMRPVLEALGQ